MSDLRQTVTIKLAEEDLLELQRILIDDDSEAALEFLKTAIALQLPKKNARHCNSYNLNQYL